MHCTGASRRTGSGRFRHGPRISWRNCGSKEMQTSGSCGRPSSRSGSTRTSGRTRSARQASADDIVQRTMFLRDHGTSGKERRPTLGGLRATWGRLSDRSSNSKGGRVCAQRGNCLYGEKCNFLHGESDRMVIASLAFAVMSTGDDEEHKGKWLLDTWGKCLPLSCVYCWALAGQDGVACYRGGKRAHHPPYHSVHAREGTRSERRVMCHVR